MAWTTNGKVEDICDATGVVFSLAYIESEKLWLAMFIHHDQPICAARRTKMFPAMGAALNEYRVFLQTERGKQFRKEHSNQPSV